MEGIPPEVAAVLRPVLPDLAAETIRAIGREVPDYSRPLEGRLGVTVRYGTERALRRFVDSIEQSGSVSDRDRRIYVELGRLEMREGRTLGALLAAYRVGAQIAWRRFVEAGTRAGLEPETLYRLGEAIFAYIDEISGESIEGYATEQSAAAGERQRRRAQLVLLLASEPPPPPEVVRAAAVRAAWAPPSRLAALVVEGIEAERLAGRLGPGTLAGVLESGDTAPAGGRGRVLAFVGDPDAPRRRAAVQEAVGSRAAALGPTVPATAAARSVERARRALDLRAAGALTGEGLVVATEHASELLLHADTRLASELAEARLAPLDAMKPGPRGRLLQTLRAWLDLQGRIDETARALEVHPQTVRYRLAQLREALGPALDDPEARFELALALRVHRDDADAAAAR
ncbi:MAG TPA: helix-turn-helix domain-containing protein [Solirubrobacteraceae bacterium]|nr:helix-turn-helix domain-containing protein [Solirubrobacteraceae bacterium]